MTRPPRRESSGTSRWGALKAPCGNCSVPCGSKLLSITTTHRTGLFQYNGIRPPPPRDPTTARPDHPPAPDDAHAPLYLRALPTLPLHRAWLDAARSHPALPSTQHTGTRPHPPSWLCVRTGRLGEGLWLVRNLPAGQASHMHTIRYLCMLPWGFHVSGTVWVSAWVGGRKLGEEGCRVAGNRSHGQACATGASAQGGWHPPRVPSRRPPGGCRRRCGPPSPRPRPVTLSAPTG